MLNRSKGVGASCQAEPRYSVIVPAYNAAGTIEACIQAILNQSVPRDAFEVMVVDDGSTDDTATVASRYPVQVLRQGHAGPASARNLGAKWARGKYLLFTDADCVPTYTWIEEIVRPMEACCEVVGVKGVYRTQQADLVARLTQVELEEKYAKLRSQQYIDFVDTYSAAFRREAFWEGGAFDPAFTTASNEDTQLSFNLAAQGRRLVFTEMAVVYHHHPSSLLRYLLRKSRHGYWRVRVYQRHPTKVAGDSYTPLSIQLQFLGAVLAVILAPLPVVQPFSLAFAALFVVATLPFVRRAYSLGWEVAALIPFVLFLRALALAFGICLGVLALLASSFRRPA